jgi:hypothetical protein
MKKKKIFGKNKVTDIKKIFEPDFRKGSYKILFFYLDLSKDMIEKKEKFGEIPPEIV